MCDQTTKPTLLLKDALDLAIRLHEYAHSNWRFYITWTLVLVGWLFTVDRERLRTIRWFLTFGVLIVGLLSLVGTTSANRYVRASVDEATEAARQATFRSAQMQQAMLNIHPQPQWLIVLINVIVVLAVLAIIWFGP